MTSKQRTIAVLNGQTPDRVPVFLMSRRLSMTFAEVGFKTCMEDESGTVYAHAQARAVERFGYDGVMDLEGVNTESELFGCTLRIDENESPSIVIHCLEKIEEADTLEIPELAGSPVASRQLNVVRELKRISGNQVPVYANVQCPFRSAVMLRGINSFMLDIIDNPEKVHLLLEKTTTMAIRYGLALADAGCDILMPSNPIASRNFISREHYKTFVLPYDREMTAAFHAQGIPTVLHICGDVNDRLDYITHSGYRGVSLDSMVDLSRAKQEIGERTTLIGNIDVFRPLREGTPQAVYNQARECLHQAASGGRFMLSPGCEPTPDTPFENIDALIRAARTFAYQQV